MVEGDSEIDADGDELDEREPRSVTDTAHTQSVTAGSAQPVLNRPPAPVAVQAASTPAAFDSTGTPPSGAWPGAQSALLLST